MLKLLGLPVPGQSETSLNIISPRVGAAGGGGGGGGGSSVAAFGGGGTGGNGSGSSGGGGSGGLPTAKPLRNAIESADPSAKAPAAAPALAAPRLSTSQLRDAIDQVQPPASVAKELQPQGSVSSRAAKRIGNRPRGGAVPRMQGARLSRAPERGSASSVVDPRRASAAGAERSGPPRSVPPTVIATAPSRGRMPGMASDEQAARLRALIAASTAPEHLKRKFHFFSFQLDGGRGADR